MLQPWGRFGERECLRHGLEVTGEHGGAVGIGGRHCAVGICAGVGICVTVSIRVGTYVRISVGAGVRIGICIGTGTDVGIGVRVGVERVEGR